MKNVRRKVEDLVGRGTGAVKRRHAVMGNEDSQPLHSTGFDTATRSGKVGQQRALLPMSPRAPALRKPSDVLSCSLNRTTREVLFSGYPALKAMGWVLDQKSRLSSSWNKLSNDVKFIYEDAYLKRRLEMFDPDSINFPSSFTEKDRNTIVKISFCIEGPNLFSGTPTGAGVCDPYALVPASSALLGILLLSQEHSRKYPFPAKNSFKHSTASILAHGPQSVTPDYARIKKIMDLAEPRDLHLFAFMKDVRPLLCRHALCDVLHSLVYENDAFWEGAIQNHSNRELNVGAAALATFYQCFLYRESFPRWLIEGSREINGDLVRLIKWTEAYNAIPNIFENGRKSAAPYLRGLQLGAAAKALTAYRSSYDFSSKMNDISTQVQNGLLLWSFGYLAFEYYSGALMFPSAQSMLIAVPAVAAAAAIGAVVTGLFPRIESGNAALDDTTKIAKIRKWPKDSNEAFLCDGLLRGATSDYCGNAESLEDVREHFQTRKHAGNSPG
jgi:hypothetical protein